MRRSWLGPLLFKQLATRPIQVLALAPVYLGQFLGQPLQSHKPSGSVRLLKFGFFGGHGFLAVKVASL